MWRHTWRKNWVNCAVLIGNSAGVRTVLSSHLSHTQICAVHSGNPKVSSVYLPIPRWHHLKPLNSFSRWALYDIFLSKYHFLLHILRFLFFFSDNIMADVASKQQTTALFLSTIITHTRRHTELTKKTDKPDEKPVLCLRFGGSFSPWPLYPPKTRVHTEHPDQPWGAGPDVLVFKKNIAFPLLKWKTVSLLSSPVIALIQLSVGKESKLFTWFVLKHNTVYTNAALQGHNLESSFYKTRQIDGRKT